MNIGYMRRWIRNRICIVVIGVLLLGQSEYIHARSQEESQKQEEPKKSSIGVSFQDQRTRVIVKARDVFYHYGEEHNVDVRIRFSDNDKYIQAYQIRNLVDSGIDILIIYAESSDEIIKALIYAKDHNVFIIAYDKLITDTFAVDFYVGFDFEILGLTDTSPRINIDAVKQVKYGKLNQTYFYDVIVLAQATIALADRFLTHPPQYTKYTQVDNNSREVSALLIDAIQITKDNYEDILIKQDIIDEKTIE